MEVTLRLERPGDHRAVENLVREAFWGHMCPDCDEHYLAHILRGSAGFVPELDYVATLDGEIVGNILYSRAKVVGEGGEAFDVLNFGPLSVSPAHQNQGIGGMLMRHTFEEARRMGHRAIVIFGHPDYYPRFGFRPAAEFGIATRDSKSFDALMALPLYDGALDGASGRFHEDEAFDRLNAEDVAAFDRLFPPKPKAALPPIEILLERLPDPARRAVESRNLEALVDFTRFSGREVAAWEGVDAAAWQIINDTLKQHGYPPKRLAEGRISQF